MRTESKSCHTSIRMAAVRMSAGENCLLLISLLQVTEDERRKHEHTYQSPHLRLAFASPVCLHKKRTLSVQTALPLTQPDSTTPKHTSDAPSAMPSQTSSSGSSGSSGKGYSVTSSGTNSQVCLSFESQALEVSMARCCFTTSYAQ